MFSLVPLPAFTDNYIWVVHNDRSAVVVDPGLGAVVADFLASRRLTLEAILVTHHHADHTGGLAELAPVCTGPVIAPARERDRIRGATRWVSEGDCMEALNMSWHVMAVPGHTSGHVAYVGSAGGGASVLMCGDTLFSAGCGRLFEGSALDMHNSLRKLAALPDDTLVCCAHEYTLSNLRFAAEVEPENADIQSHQRYCEDLRQRNLPTLPSSICQEKAINPFLRTHLPQVQRSVAASVGRTTTAGADTLGALREWKNRF